jgi:hypothetical protein
MEIYTLFDHAAWPCDSADDALEQHDEECPEAKHCGSCGREIVSVGAGYYDWEHVPNDDDPQPDSR